MSNKRKGLLMILLESFTKKSRKGNTPSKNRTVTGLRYGTGVHK